MIDKFAEIFSNFEEIGILNHENNIDIWALHKVYIEEIQNKLDEFHAYYNKNKNKK